MAPPAFLHRWGGVEHLPVHVKLELARSRVPDPDRSGPPIALQVVELDLR